MITVADAVNDILSEDGLIIEALQRQVLNISAYAKQILPEVEERAKKPVREGTVIVALSRLADKMTAQPPIAPQVHIDSFSITSSLCGISYGKSDMVIADLSHINYSYIDNTNAFFAMTIGISEVTVICSNSLEQRITQSLSQQPKALIDDLVALSVRFSANYISVPNTIYSLVGIFAARHINIMEIVSTYTEVTFVIYEHEMELAIQALQTYQKATTTPTTTTSSGG